MAFEHPAELDVLATDEEAADLVDDPFSKLFARWENQPWEATRIDLERDRVMWHRLPTALRSELGVTISELGGGDVAVTRLLVPLLESAPQESWRLYLTTQLSDEARHAVFFRRYAGEVLEGESKPTSEGCAVRDFDDSAFQTEFTPLLTAAVHAVDGGVASWHRASTLYHLVTEGVLGVTVLRIGRALAGNRGLLPGLAQGVAAVFRDESRHITFGRRAAQAGIASGHGAVIAKAYLDGLGAAARVMVGPGRPEVALGARSRAQRATNRRVRVDEACERAVRQAQVLALPLERDDVEAVWSRARDQALAEYEGRWGLVHSLVSDDRLEAIDHA